MRMEGNDDLLIGESLSRSLYRFPYGCRVMRVVVIDQRARGRLTFVFKPAPRALKFEKGAVGECFIEMRKGCASRSFCGLRVLSIEFAYQFQFRNRLRRVVDDRSLCSIQNGCNNRVRWIGYYDTALRYPLDCFPECLLERGEG